MRDIRFLTPRALLLHWRWCALFWYYFLVFLPYFILWQVWKDHNAVRFHSQSFSINVIIFQVYSNRRLASSAFWFKHSQVRGVFGSWIAEGLWVIAPPKRLIRLVSWMRPPPGVVKLTMDRCSTGNHQMATLGDILRDHQGVVLGASESFIGR